MGRKYIKTIIIFGLVTLMICSAIVPKTFAGNDNGQKCQLSLGDILYVGGSGPGNYSTVQDAIDNATDGDTVFVYNGVYTGKLVINKSISLIGEDKKFTIFDPNDDVKDFGEIFANNVYISGFTFKAGCLFLYKINSCVIQENIFNNLSIGIQCFEVRNITISSNILINIDYPTAIKLFVCNDSFISENTISNMEGDGIFLAGGNNNKLFKNDISGITTYDIFTHLYSGIRLFKCNNNTLTYNNFQNCLRGVFLENSSNTIITKNNFISNKLSLTFTDTKYNSNYHIYNNFWDRKRSFPKILFGIKLIPTLHLILSKGFPIPQILTDEDPAKEPFEV